MPCQLQRPRLGDSLAHDTVVPTVSSECQVESAGRGGGEGEAVQVALRSLVYLVSPRHRAERARESFLLRDGVMTLLVALPPLAVARKKVTTQERYSRYVWLSCSSCLRFWSSFPLLFSNLSWSACMYHVSR
jgi:hypothetical protein